MKKLNNKIVFITGGLSGIGYACATAVAEMGAKVVIADLASDKVDEIMNTIQISSPESIFVACNVSNASELSHAIDTVVEKFGSLDIALNNAGIGGEPNKTGDMTAEQWLKVININLNGVFYSMKYELLQMQKQRKGVIVNMASILGKVGFSGSGHYVAAKHGVIGLTKVAAMEYASDGIRINAICPGFIQTPLLSKAGISDHTEVLAQIVNLHPMKRLGKAEEIAQAFIFLASDDSSFVTGTALDVDGGYLTQ